MSAESRDTERLSTPVQVLALVLGVFMMLGGLILLGSGDLLAGIVALALAAGLLAGGLTGLSPGEDAPVSLLVLGLFLLLMGGTELREDLPAGGAKRIVGDVAQMLMGGGFLVAAFLRHRRSRSGASSTDSTPVEPT